MANSKGTGRRWQATLGPAALPAKPKGAEPAYPPEIVHRLRRVEGQIRGVLLLMEQGGDCDLIAQQLSAARKALDRAFFEMMACSLETEIRQVSGSPKLSDRVAKHTRLLSKYA